MQQKTKIIALSVLGSIISILVLLVFASYTPINYGTVGVVTRFGAVTGRIVKPGLNWRIPFIDSVVVYNTQKITYETSDNPDTSMANYTDYPVNSTTKDGQQINIKYTVRFAVDPTKVEFVANNLGTESDVVEKIVKMDSRTHMRNIPRTYTAEELYTEKVFEVQARIFEILDESFKENGMVLDDVGIREIRFSQEYLNTIEMKQIEKEKVASEQYKAEQEKYRKEQVIIHAQGEAEAQRLQQATLSKEIIQKLWVEKWDGQLPHYVGSDSTLFLNMSE